MKRVFQLNTTCRLFRDFLFKEACFNHVTERLSNRSEVSSLKEFASLPSQVFQNVVDKNSVPFES